jgi:hypothetical protein
MASAFPDVILEAAGSSEIPIERSEAILIEPPARLKGKARLKQSEYLLLPLLHNLVEGGQQAIRIRAAEQHYHVLA